MNKFFLIYINKDKQSIRKLQMAINFLHNGEIVNVFNKALANLNNNEGSLILIEGEKGFGKTRMLAELESIAHREKKIAVIVKTSEPIYNMSISNLQPYAVFNNILNELNSSKKIPQNQRLAFNVGLTILTGLPIAGDLFYMVKELKKDLQEHKKQKRMEKLENEHNYLEVFKEYTQKNPCVVLIDDFQFADIQSVELLKFFTEHFGSLKMILVVAFNPNFVQRSNLAMRNYLKFVELDAKNTKVQRLTPFDTDLTIKAISSFYPNSVVSESVVNWFIQKTYGVPAAIYEYLEYFAKHNITLSQIAQENFDSFVPMSVNALFLSYVEQLTDEERNILSICAAEGKEFSVSIASKLMSLDVLSTVRKLKSIAQKTGIISSLGAKKRYGELTTIFTFNQAIYQSYFEEQLEYEEKKALHSQISSILKQNYDNTEDKELKRELLPYIVSHSDISGDEDMVKEVLKDQYRIAQEDSNETFIQSISNFLNNVNNSPIYPDSFLNPNPEESTLESIPEVNFSQSIINGEADISAEDLQIEPRKFHSEIIPPKTALNFEEIIEFAASNHSDEVVGLINQFIDKSPNQLDKIKSTLLLSKFLAENNQLDQAMELINKLSYKIDDINPNETDILYLNTLAILQHNQGKETEAIQTLKKAAELSIKHDSNYKILTLSNISILLKKYDYENAIKYKEFVIKSARELDYSDFIEDYLKQF